MDPCMNKRSSARKRPSLTLPRRSAGWLLESLIAGALSLSAVARLAWPRPTPTPEMRAAPRMKVDRDRVDLGSVKLGSWGVAD